MTTEEYLIKRHKIDTNDEPPYFNSRIPGRCRVKDAVDKWTREHEIAKWFILVGSWRPNWFWVK